MKRYLVTLLLIVAAVAAAFGQKTERFTHGPGRFSVSASSKPVVESSHFRIDTYDLSGESLKWKTGEHSWASVDYYEVIGYNEKLTPADKEKVTQRYLDALVTELEKGGAATQKKRFTAGGIEGWEVSATAARKALSRFFFAANRFFVQQAIGEPGEYEQHVALLDSFRILSKPEYVAVRISENTPPALPQSPKVKRSLSDAAENGLKGHVKSITCFSKELPADPRFIESHAEYDDAGYLISEINYMRGYPTDSASWGWLDGNRVSIDKNITYGMSEGPNENGTILLMGTIDPDADKKPRPPSDDRFTFRYDYKYDTKGRITDWFMFLNDGSLSQHRVYTYPPGKRETKIFDEKGELNSSSVEILNTTGDVIEETAYDYKGKLVGITTYRYELDKLGNWIVKRSFEKSTKAGRAVFKPAGVQDRTITYY